MAKLSIGDIKKKAIIIVEPDFSYIDGKYLRSFRMSMQMSQNLFADYLGVSKKAIEKWEQGKNKVNALVQRMIYIMEKDPSVFSLLKEVRINGEVFEMKPAPISFIQEMVDKDFELDDVFSDSDIEVNNMNNKWNYYSVNYSKRSDYGTASI